MYNLKHIVTKFNKKNITHSYFGQLQIENVIEIEEELNEIFKNCRLILKNKINIYYYLLKKKINLYELDELFKK